MLRRRTGLALIAIGILVASLAWIGTRWSYAVLASPSMEPFASSGDLLLHRLVPAHQIVEDDVITVPVTDRGLVTHRVVRVLRVDDRIVVRLKGDQSRLPDPVPIDLVGDVARVEIVVPVLGAVLRVGAPLLWGGTVLLVAGAGALFVSRRREEREERVPVPATAPEPVPTATVVDPRVEALLATCEQFAEDGFAPVVLADLVRVRVAMLVGLPPAERAGIVLDLDDGGRFYVIALADADPDALGLVPASSRRRRAATAALDVWWDAVSDRLDAAVAETVEPWLSDAAWSTWSPKS